MNNTEPVFKSIFGQQWEILPEILQRRFSNRPYSNDVITAEGKLDISFSRIMSWMMPIFRLTKTLVPYKGKNIKVLVNFRSEAESTNIYYERTFYFPGKRPVYFYSYLTPTSEHKIIEFISLGFGCKMKCSYQSGKVLLEQNKIIWKLFGIIFPIPLSFIFGKITAEEQALSNNSFRMLMKITHPLFGNLFEYGGEFKLL